MNSERRRHEVRDERGQLIAVIDIVGDNRAEGVPSMVELAADFDGGGVRVRVFGMRSNDMTSSPRLPHAA